MAAMAGAAGDRRAGVVDFGNIVAVDVLHHLEHLARGLLVFLRVIGEVETWLAVGADVLGVGGMTGFAAGTQLAFPFFHDFVNLLPGQVAWQDFQVGGGRHFMGWGWTARLTLWRRRGWVLGGEDLRTACQ
jgi:hypothetical protein